MILQHRKMDNKLVYKLQIARRTQVSNNKIKELEYSLRGYFGEVAFDKLSDKSLNNGITLRNLNYIVNNKIFQIDSLILMNGDLYIFEVKDFTSDLYYVDGQYYYADQSPCERINNQMERTPKLFTLLLKNSQLHYNFHYYHAFINPTHKVYGYHATDKILEQARICKFISENSQMPVGAYDIECCEKLLSLQDISDPFNFRTPHNFHNFKKGVLCECMKSFYTKHSNRKYKCSSCNKIIDCDHLLDSAIQEIKLIFPDERITTHILKAWTKSLVSREKIRLFLNKRYRRHQLGSIIYYE